MTEKQIWFTSDLHVDHKNIIEYCDRPWTFEDQRFQIINRWNSRVRWQQGYHEDLGPDQRVER